MAEIKWKNVVITKEVAKAVVHRCELPAATMYGAGTECQCDCGKKYIIKAMRFAGAEIGHRWVRND